MIEEDGTSRNPQTTHQLSCQFGQFGDVPTGFRVRPVRCGAQLLCGSIDVVSVHRESQGRGPRTRLRRSQQATSDVSP